MARRLPWILLGVAGLVIVALWLRIDRLQDELIATQQEPRVQEQVASTKVDGSSTEEESLPIELPGSASEPSNEMLRAEATSAGDFPEVKSSKNELTPQQAEEKMRAMKEDIHRRTATRRADRQYAELYRILALDADTEQVVREVITAGLYRKEVSQSELSGFEVTIGAINRLRAEASAEIDAELQSILTADELAAWREYEATLDQRQMEIGVLVLMVKTSTNLAEASRDTVAVVLTQEWLAARESFADEAPTDTVNATITAEAAESALNRLYELLDENEFALAEEFVQTFVEQTTPKTPQKNEDSKSLT